MPDPVILTGNVTRSRVIFGVNTEHVFFMFNGLSSSTVVLFVRSGRIAASLALIEQWTCFAHSILYKYYAAFLPRLIEGIRKENSVLGDLSTFLSVHLRSDTPP